jgi:toxin-antitoxin system PIN domain toxin
LKRDTEASWLFDVNALIALIDSSHIHHDAIHQWFSKHAKRGWATCALTENGAVRILSQSAYPGGQRTPTQVLQFLRIFKESNRSVYTFFNNNISLTDESLFDTAHLTKAVQIMDAYLLGLALKHNVRLVTFDRDVPWQAVRGGSPDLIVRPV